MMIDGLRLLAVGMTTVFAFLTLLVASMHATAALVARFAPDPPDRLDDGPDREEEEAIAVALAAIARSRS